MDIIDLLASPRGCRHLLGVTALNYSSDHGLYRGKSHNTCNECYTAYHNSQHLGVYDQILGNYSPVGNQFWQHKKSVLIEAATVCQMYNVTSVLSASAQDAICHVVVVVFFLCCACLFIYLFVCLFVVCFCLFCFVLFYNISSQFIIHLILIIPSILFSPFFLCSGC